MPDPRLDLLQEQCELLTKILAAIKVSGRVSREATPTFIAATSQQVQLLAENYGRKAAYIFNDGSQTLYIGLFVRQYLSTSLYTAQIPSLAFYEIPTEPTWLGEICGFWPNGGTGGARITEFI